MNQTPKQIFNQQQYYQTNPEQFCEKLTMLQKSTDSLQLLSFLSTKTSNNMEFHFLLLYLTCIYIYNICFYDHTAHFVLFTGFMAVIDINFYL